MTLRLRKLVLFAGLCVLASCASPTTRQGILVELPAARRSAGDTPLPPAARDVETKTTAQQAAGNLAANIEADLRAEVAALKAENAMIKGVEYHSDLPWKAVVVCLGALALQQVQMIVLIVLSHRREMARIHKG